MKYKPITFEDLKGMDLVGCWAELWLLRGKKLFLGNHRYLIRSIKITANYLQAESLGLLAYNAMADRWDLASDTKFYDAFYNRACEEYYSGPMQLDSGEIVWFLGNLSDPSSGHKIYRKGVDPPRNPFGINDLYTVSSALK